MADRLRKDDLARYLGQRILEDADKLRLFMPKCFAHIPLEWDGHVYEVRVIYQGPTHEA